MKLLYARLGAALLLLSLTACGATNPGDDWGTPTVPPKTLYELAQADPTLSLLAQTLAKADLANTLASEGPFTFFAPTDDAIKALAEGAGQNETEFLERTDLANIFKYHIVPDRKLATEFKDGDTLTTLQGYDVNIEVTEGGEIKVEAATVITRDMLATNGVMHIISEVLIPPALGSSVYDLSATGVAGTDVSGTATLRELSPAQSEVVLNVTGASPGDTLTVHIHKGNVPDDITADSGEIAYELEPINVRDDGSGESAKTFDVPYSSLSNYDGYLTVHSPTGAVIAYGGIGANGTPIDELRAKATH